MGRNISDVIETYLKEIMSRSDEGVVEVQRSELAELFQCVPSQINYVISTRFSFDRGYMVESKRGGGGYIRIRQITVDPEHFLAEFLRQYNRQLSERESEDLLSRLRRDNLLTAREAAMVRALMRRDVLGLELPARDQLRARLFNQVIQVILTIDN